MREDAGLPRVISQGDDAYEGHRKQWARKNIAHHGRIAGTMHMAVDGNGATRAPVTAGVTNFLPNARPEEPACCDYCGGLASSEVLSLARRIPGRVP